MYGRSTAAPHVRKITASCVFPIFHFPISVFRPFLRKHRHNLRRQQSQLPHQPHLIPNIPAFYNHAIRRLQTAHPNELDGLPRRRSSKKISSVIRGHGKSPIRRVVLLHHVVQLDVHFRKRLPHRLIKRPKLLWPARRSIRPAHSPHHRIPRKHFINRVFLPLIPNFLKPATHQRASSGIGSHRWSCGHVRTFRHECGSRTVTTCPAL